MSITSIRNACLLAVLIVAAVVLPVTHGVHETDDRDCTLCQLRESSIGDVVKHRHFDFRGVIYDVDFEFNSSEEWYKSIPKDVRPRKDQPFYHLLAENNEITYEAYVSEQNLVSDDSDEPIKHPLIEEIFTGKRGSGYFKPSN